MYESICKNYSIRGLTTYVYKMFKNKWNSEIDSKIKKKINHLQFISEANNKILIIICSRKKQLISFKNKN